MRKFHYLICICRTLCELVVSALIRTLTKRFICCIQRRQLVDATASTAKKTTLSAPKGALYAIAIEWNKVVALLHKYILRFCETYTSFWTAKDKNTCLITVNVYHVFLPWYAFLYFCLLFTCDCWDKFNYPDMKWCSN